MGVLTRLVHGRAAELNVGDAVIHIDIGEVTIAAIDGRHVEIEDATGDSVWVPAKEIC